MTTLYLIRHAHADWSTDDNRPLSKAGYAAARALCEQLADYPITAIYSSPHRRVIETITPLAKHRALQPHLIADLRERELPPVGADEFERVVEETWRTPALSVRGGEPNETAQARGVAIIRDLLARHVNEQIVVATHGTLLALMLNGFDQTYGYDFWRTLTLPDAYKLNYSGKLIAVHRIPPET
jgi:2,3-bisphosphoglycerate-dependent phosphoglycerate mutase